MTRAALLLSASLLVLTGCPQDSPEPAADDDDPEDPGPTWEAIPGPIADALADEVDARGAPGAAVAILHGDTLYAAGFGSRDPDADDPVAPTTLFRIGSVTKMLTATALLTQVDDGALSLDDALTDHLPELSLQGAGDVDGITLHDLLSHQGGIADYTPVAGGEEDSRLIDHALGAFGVNAYLMNPAGEFWNYSNPNFSLAGAVVEDAGGAWYREVMDEAVFSPLGMDRTLFLADEVLADGDYAVAFGRDWQGSGQQVRVEPDAYDDAFSRPAGFAWSSVLDLALFGEFLLDGDEAVLSSAMHTELTSTQVDTLAFLDRLGYGYGVMRWDGASADGWYELETIEHGGAIPGFAAELITVPEHDLVIATLASTDGLYFDRGIAAIFEELLGVESAPAPDLEIDPADFDEYVGTYIDPVNVGTIVVTRTGDDLFVEMPDLEAASVPYSTVLTPTSRRNFQTVVQNFPMGLTFVDTDGGSAGAEYYRTRYFVAARSDGLVDGRSAPTLTAEERRARIDAMIQQVTNPTLQ